MLIRIRTVFVIFLTTLIIISFSVLVGIATVRRGIEMSQEADLLLISDIADHFISGEVKSLKLKAAGTAQLLSFSESSQWPDVLESLENRHPEFIGKAVWDENRNLIASAGELPALFGAADEMLMQQAFQGKTVISSIIPAPSGTVFYLAAPIPGINDKMLMLALPGTYFSDLVSDFSIWDTGHIFMDDAEGRLISNIRPEWVSGKVDFLSMAEIDASNTETVNELRQALGSGAEIIRYSIFGVPRICAYRPVSESEEGWLLGVVAPLPESPFLYINRGLIAVGVVSLLLSLVAAVIASNFIKKPFEEIAALKEEAEASSKYKSDFLANMSHEIRTPMNTILGVVEILTRDKTISQSVSEGLYKIQSSGDLLLNIINDILDLSRIEAGKLELSPSAYDSASLINDTTSLNMMRIGSKEIEFRISVDENMPQTLIGDEIRIKQILNNLLSNAFKYTEKGEVALSFSVQGDDVGTTLVFSVSDTGQGMTEQQVAALFDQYSRFNLEANRAIEGTGLGMNIASNLIRMMNGDIDVESEPQKGSVFTVRLPQERAGTGVLGKDLAQNLQSFQLNGVKQLRKASIAFEPMPYGSVLIVDDVESNLFVAKGLLLPYELSVDTVTNGFDAIDRIKKGGSYDIIFMDHMMPEMDGMEATKIIRSAGYTRPIVALTANAVKGQHGVFLAGGFDDFISKPIDTRRLNAVLKKYIRDKQPTEAPDDNDSLAVRNPEENSNDADTDPYLSVPPELAGLFVKDALRFSAELETLQKKGGEYDDEDILLYTTSVHALKSALANVGEYGLSDFSANLERAGKNKDMAMITSETPALLSELREVIEKVSALSP